MPLYQVTLRASAIVLVRAQNGEEAGQRAQEQMMESNEAPRDWLVTTVKDERYVFPDDD